MRLMRDDTMDASHGGEPRAEDRVEPGLVAAFSAGKATAIAIPVGEDGVIVGRAPGAGMLPDDRLSRRHAEIARTSDGWTVRDLASRNGTFVDGVAVVGRNTLGALRTIRIGDTILVPSKDVRGAQRVDRGDIIAGTSLGGALARVADAARLGDTLLVLGESGTGKELAARTFHESGDRASGPFIAVNCAAIPQGVAERLLFGTKRGAYSGADADAQGHVQAANRGVLFLDEIGELDLQVQAKLLRFLESREATPLGAAVGQKVDVRVCVATHRDLRTAVAEGRFRADLYHRLTPPTVTLPPLRERLDEIAWHIVAVIAEVSPAVAAHVRLVEACLLRPWPGNVRELRKEIRHAAARALQDGSDRVRLEHLGESAGLAFAIQGDAAAHGDDRALQTGKTSEANNCTGRSYVRWSSSLTREQIERALTENGGRIADAARSLGMQRTQLYREMARWSITPSRN